MQKGLRSKAATTTTLSTWLSGHSQGPPGRPCPGNSSQTGRVYAYGRNRVGPLTIAKTDLPQRWWSIRQITPDPFAPNYGVHISSPPHAAGLACGTTSSQTAMIICDSNGWQRYLRSVPGIVYRRKIAAISALLGVSLPHEARSNARLGWGGRVETALRSARRGPQGREQAGHECKNAINVSFIRPPGHNSDQQLLNLMHAQQCASM